MLEVHELGVRTDDRTLFSKVDIHVRPGETVVLFGPNGSGKTSLLHTIMGLPGYEIFSGSILYKGKDITGLRLHERARLGLGIAYQRPPVVRGVRLAEALSHIRACCSNSNNDGASLTEAARKLRLEEFLQRDLNLGFSGGEVKRAELLQLQAQDPDFVMFDEPDSGVDLESVRLVGDVINSLLEKDKPFALRKKAGMIVTHAGYILDYVNADRAYVMMDGRIFCSGTPLDLLEDIKSRGYSGCKKCVL